MSTQHLLRPNQKAELEDTRESLKRQVSNPYIQNKSAVMRQLRQVDNQLETQTPKPFTDPVEESKAVKREKQLREEMLVGMPSQEEMRKSPPGAIGKHRDWEKKNKQKMLEWKNLSLRLQHDSSDPDVANFERYRPKASSLNMDNAFIPGKQIFLAPDSPAFREGYDNIEWESQKEAKSEKKAPKKKSKGRGMSAEARKAASERMKAMHAAKKAAKADKE